MSEKFFSVGLDDIIDYFESKGYSLENEKDSELFERFQTRFMKAVDFLSSDAENYMQEALEDAT